MGAFKPIARAVLLVLGVSGAAHARCPFATSGGAALPVAPERRLLSDGSQTSLDFDYADVKAKIEELLTDSKDFWPADFGNYAPFMIRLAWHCAGSYRYSDGRGGCDGGRIRLVPEFAWEDNTNLDKALKLLEPLKLELGDSISWGDLIILTGNVAIESMGGPIFGFCGGRVDDPDGKDSLVLGPTPEQEAVMPCQEQGKCGHPLGPTTVGLIYVNPGGPLQNGNPKDSAPDIRNAFSRMGMDDRETVALIGGGHAFGKVHGACPDGQGPGPLENPINPWSGTCGSGPMRGKGENTATSGYEGPWTTKPTEWTNDYFRSLIECDWVEEESPAGLNQWRPEPKPDVKSDLCVEGIMMLTSDLALINDDAYLAIVKEYADDIKKLEDTFSKAWYKLTSGDMGPRERCLGSDVPPPQPFQDPLPDDGRRTKDITSVKKTVKGKLEDGELEVGELVKLAYQCASTFRITDYRGGCNGARIRFPPQKEFAGNEGLDKVLEKLDDVYDDHAITWSDLIVLAGQVALEEAGSPDLDFCSGRTDVDEDGASTEVDLSPRDYYNDAIVAAYDNMQVMGLTPQDWVALAGRPMGKDGKISNQFYKDLLSKTWKPTKGDLSVEDMLMPDTEFESDSKNAMKLTASVLAISWDPPMKAIVQAYASDEQMFKDALASAWLKLMNADMFGKDC